MRRSTRWMLVPLLALVAAARAAPPEQIPWLHGLEAAQADAKGRNVPLLVVLNMDGERGNDAMVAEVYTAPAVRDAAKRCAVTIASMYEHDAAPDAFGRKVCSRFGSVTCAEHRATETVVRKEWLQVAGNDTIDSPRHLFRAPDGRPLFQRTWTIDPESLVKLIDRAVAACAGPELAAWDTTEGRLKRVSDPIDCVREGAIADLAGAKDPAVDAQLFEIARKTDDAGVAASVLAAMAASMSPGRAEGMRKLLSAPSPAVRMQAIAALAHQKGKETYDALAAAYAKEKQTPVRCVLLRALACCGGDPAKARELLLKTAKSGDGDLRVHAVAALAPWAKEDAVVDALRKMPANEKLPETLRMTACWTLGLSGRKEVAADLEPVTKEKSKGLAGAAGAATARLNGTDDPQYLRWRFWLAPLEVRLPEEVP